MSKSSEFLKQELGKLHSKSSSSLNRSNIALISTEYQQKLRTYCHENSCYAVPNIRIYYEGSNKDNTALQHKIPYPSSIIFLDIFLKKVYHEEVIDKMIYRNLPIETSLLISIQKCFGEKVTVLKLQYCSMTSEQIEILSKFLQTNHSIKEVNINGNPNEEQNYFLLLKDTDLINLSLKFCSIDCNGIEKISAQLSTPFESKLLHLNLSSNLLFDEGIDYVAKFLRTNRTLISLNLADNKIQDEGCIKLLESLQKFSLTHEEIVSKRRMKFDIYQKSKDKIPNEAANSKKNVLLSKDMSEAVILDPPQEAKSKTLTIGDVDDEKLTIENHPFIQDSYEENKEVYCKGNITLINLNLAYNNIKKQGLESIIKMLRYQKYMRETTVLNDNDKGVLRISLEGNDFYKCSYELNELDGLLNKKIPNVQDVTRKSQTSIKKKSSRMSS